MYMEPECNYSIGVKARSITLSIHQYT